MKSETIRFGKTVEQLEKKCKGLVEESNVPGLAVAIISKKDIIYMKGFGYTDKNKTKKVDENTRFAYQSTGKSIVAAITLKAVQDGIINLDDPIIKYYPEFCVQSIYENTPQNIITFRHLLSHSSGFQDGTPPGVGFDENGEVYDPTYEERMESLQGSWLRYRVGSVATYSNFGIDLVTYGLQRASGKSYPEFVRESFSELLGMDSMIFDREVALKDEDTAKGYLGNHEAVIRDSVAYGAGMPFLSIKDLATFAQFLLNKGSLKDTVILKEEYLDEMFQGDYSMDYFEGPIARYYSYGLGIFLNSINGKIKVLHHPGGAFGYNSSMVLVPELEIAIIMMSNNEYYASLEGIAIEALRNLLDEKGINIEDEEKIDRRKDEVKEETVESFKKLEGWYASVGYDSFLIQYKDKKLFLGSQELTQHEGGEFSAPNIHRLAFEPDDSGNLKYLIYWHENHGKIKAKFIRKIEAESVLRKEEIKKYVGLYHYYYYGIEKGYFAVIEKNNSLILTYGDDETVLYQSSVKPELFFDYKGTSYEFYKDFFLIGQVKMFKLDDPIEEFKRLAESEHKSRYINEDSLNWAEKLLRKLGREKEADSISNLKQGA